MYRKRARIPSYHYGSSPLEDSNLRKHATGKRKQGNQLIGNIIHNTGVPECIVQY